MRLATLLVLIALAVMIQPAYADSVVGVGIFGGVGSPGGDQLDAVKESKSGPHFGMRIPVNFGKFFSLEPFFDRTEGESDLLFASPSESPTIDGYDVNAFGINLGIGRLVNNKGFNIAPYAGAAIHKFRREHGPADDPFGWRAGLALGLATSEVLHLSLRGEYAGFSELENEANSRNYVNVTLGATCVIKPR